MESVGETLKRAREKKQISVAELAKRTRVRAEFLEALEEDRYEIFPARTYVVGFLRSCARALGLDEEELLRRFRADRGEESPENEALWGDEPEAPPEAPNRLLPLLLLLVVAAAAAAIFFLRR
ncbi:MAG: helix-turn-helix domain-containing protein [Candidatus Eisenbacteria bacterium]